MIFIKQEPKFANTGAAFPLKQANVVVSPGLQAQVQILQS